MMTMKAIILQRQPFHLANVTLATHADGASGGVDNSGGGNGRGRSVGGDDDFGRRREVTFGR